MITEKEEYLESPFVMTLPELHIVHVSERKQWTHDELSALRRLTIEDVRVLEERHWPLAQQWSNPSPDAT